MGGRKAGGKTGKNAAYNWHPAVHAEHFEETLTFVMIRLHEPLHRPVAEQVRDLLQAADIKHACAYPLFGWWDALIRVWLTVPARQRLAEVLDQSAGHNVEDTRDFTTDEIRYLWHGATENLLSPEESMQALITTNASKIDEVAASPEKTATATWRHLKKEGLLFLRPTMPKRGVKFYTALSRTSEPRPEKHEVDAIMRAMHSTSLGSGRTASTMETKSSLYCGSGNLAAYLVRCVAYKFDDVLALAESFDMHLEKTGLRPETLIVANPNAVFESDYVNNPLHLNQDDNKTARLLGVPPNKMAELSASNRQALNDLTVKACELANANSDLRTLLLKILCSSALNSRKDMQDSLSFLGPQFEPELKRLLIGAFAYTYGKKNWLTKVRLLCSQNKRWEKHASREMVEPLKKWTLGTYVRTAQAVASIEPKFRGHLRKELGSDWSTKSDSSVCLRNDYTHGRVYEMSRYDQYDALWESEDGLKPERWVDYLRRTMDAAVFSNKICEKSGGMRGSEDE